MTHKLQSIVWLFAFWLCAVVHLYARLCAGRPNRVQCAFTHLTPYIGLPAHELAVCTRFIKVFENADNVTRVPRSEHSTLKFGLRSRIFSKEGPCQSLVFCGAV